MALAEDFQGVLDTLPPDWTQLELDLRIADEDRYVEAATLLVHDQRDALLASTTGTGACGWRTSSATPPRRRRSRGTLALLDDNGIEGELAVREARSGRVEVVQMWGRPESVRQEFRRRRDQ